MFSEIFDVVVISDISQVPVIQSSSTHHLIVSSKTELPHQMERRPGRSTKPSDVTRVRRNFRLDQRHVKRRRRRLLRPLLYLWVDDFSHFCCPRIQLRNDFTRAVRFEFLASSRKVSITGG